ncbi:MAG: helix-turn-helix domain-containing protein [Clostridium sp.]|nr:helix-turn-helix domain-containing protein [Clostridium sp.]
MDEQRKYEVIKRLVDENGNKDRAALTLGITKRHVNRLIRKYKENGREAFRQKGLYISALRTAFSPNKGKRAYIAP